MEDQKQETSRTEEVLEGMISDLESALQKARAIAMHRIRRYNIPKDGFMKLLGMHGAIAIAHEGRKDEFEFTPEVQAVADQLWLYTTGSNEFAGDLNKGIVLMGAIGCGKTLIMKAYFNTLDHMNAANKNKGMPYYAESDHTFLTAVKLYQMKVNQEDGCDRMPRNLIIDELGREPKSGKIFGSDVFPIYELIHERHQMNLVTHATSNYDQKDLLEMYGPMLGDRLKQMFNFIEMKGKSKRK